ncbi:MAG: MotA/TolQ/ExbB proton channel family protein [bacterium]|nr:MotA/TolQ/ExbB proton channel family protein [bacterium]
MTSNVLKVVLIAGLAMLAGTAGAQEPAETPPVPAVDAPVADNADTDPVTPASVLEEESGPELTLWYMVRHGGPVQYFIAALSLLAFVMAFYFILTITPAREVPTQFMKRALAQIETGDLRGAYQMCEGRDELLANVLRAGLKMHGHDRYVIQEAMESEGERGATELWQKISYLNNIGVIAPLLGLLGTVLGMIGAFSAIALDDSQRRGLQMAASVAQAMLTTAEGLFLAIPCLAVYFFLRGRVIRIVSLVEAQASELIEALTRGRS